MTEGDRPYVFALFGLLVLLATMALGPLQGYTTAADRVDELEAARDQLSAEVDALDEQRERLNDPEEVELLARADLGLVKPGELPYVVVTPEPEFRDVGPDEPTEPEPDAAWYRRLGRTLAEWFGVS